MTPGAARGSASPRDREAARHQGATEVTVRAIEEILGP